MTETHRRCDALYRTAVHEAGHAVIARVLDVAAGHVTAVEDHNSSGHSTTLGPYEILQEWKYQGRHREMRRVWVGRILTFMAGAEAERALLGFCHGGDGDDRLQIGLMLEELDPRSRTGAELEARLRAFAASLCRRHASRIGDLCAALLRRTSLADGEIRQIIDVPVRPHSEEAMAMAAQGLF